MTDEELEAIREEYRRDDRSRMGEVLTEVSRLRRLHDLHSEHVHCRSEIDRLRAERNEALAVLARLEWAGAIEPNGARRCPDCRGMENALRRHAPDCGLKALLAD